MSKKQKSGTYPKVILASASKARQKLIKKLGIKISFLVSGYTEDMNAIEDYRELAEFLAFGKAEYIAAKHSHAIIIGADTFIIVDGEKIGKPTSLKHAREMVEKMSNKWIEVISGVAALRTDMKGKIINQTITHEITRLKIKKLTEKDIKLLVTQKDVLKISGAFGIEGIGGKMVEKIEGDYDNVIGLPLQKLERMLIQIMKAGKNVHES